jgi:tripartite-type tricarboxylate transporter receptor subunit TctC
LPAPTVLLVNTASPYRTLSELLEVTRASPGSLTMGNSWKPNHVTSVFLPDSGLQEQLKAGKLRALASASRTRSGAGDFDYWD